MSEAYRSVVELSFDVRAGLVMRQAHHWAAIVFIASLVVHLLRVFFTGAFRRPREINWIVGLTLLILAFFNGFTGYSLPDDLLSGTGLRIAYSIALSVPVIGTWLAFLIFGGEFPDQEIIPRLFVTHIFIVPAAIAGLVTVHLALVWRQKHTDFPGPGRRESNVIGPKLWPTYTAYSLGLFFAVSAVLMAMGGLVQVNPVWLYGPFRAAEVPSPAQPDWWLGWVEGALRIFPPWQTRALGYEIPNPFYPGVLVPTVTFGILYLWPFLEARVRSAPRHVTQQWKRRPPPIRGSSQPAVQRGYSTERVSLLEDTSRPLMCPPPALNQSRRTLFPEAVAARKTSQPGARGTRHMLAPAGDDQLSVRNRPQPLDTGRSARLRVTERQARTALYRLQDSPHVGLAADTRRKVTCSVGETSSSTAFAARKSGPMRIRPLSELAAVDELTQRFTPHGFGLDRILTLDSTAEFHQYTIAEADLVDAVPAEVRAAFESVRTCHTYGVLSYDLFGIAANLTFFVLERALRVRFVEFYNSVVPVENSSGATAEIPMRSFDDLHDGFRPSGIHHKQGWRLKLMSSGQRVKMPLYLTPLLAWARSEQLLDGQASKLYERRIPMPRNWFAHGETLGPGMPQESARRIHDLAEIINRLWGARTPGGRLYPTALARQVAALASSTFEGRRHLAVMDPAQIPDQLAEAGDDATFLLVAAAPEDHKLLDFNSHYERTTYPAELIWGPGDGRDAHAWWQEHQPACVPVDHLDRLFAIQVDDDKVYLPRRPEIAFGLPPEKRSGTWHIIRADEPTAAFVHVRNVVNGGCRATQEPRCGCAVNEVATGSWRQVKNLLEPYGVFPLTGPPVSLPELFPLPSSVGSD